MISQHVVGMSQLAFLDRLTLTGTAGFLTQ